MRAVADEREGSGELARLASVPSSGPVDSQSPWRRLLALDWMVKSSRLTCGTDELSGESKGRRGWRRPKSVSSRLGNELDRRGDKG
jgi:hypothetical protein